MTEAALKKYRDKLQTLGGRLHADFTHVRGEALQQTGGEAPASLSNLPMHLADLGTDNAVREVDLLLLAQESRLLEQIKGALDRLDQGTFGRCQECHKQIPAERLEALPYAPHCLECARIQEAATPPGEQSAPS